MKHYILSALLLAGLASCTKKDPDPTPAPAPVSATLEARWQIDSVYTTGQTAATQYQKKIDKIYPAGLAYAEITTNKFVIYYQNTVDKQWNYTRSGNTMYREGNTDWLHTSTINILTAKRLVLSYQEAAVNKNEPSQYSRVYTTYSR